MLAVIEVGLIMRAARGGPDDGSAGPLGGPIALGGARTGDEPRLGFAY